MAFSESQLPNNIIGIFSDALEHYKHSPSITQENKIPSTTNVRLYRDGYWIKVPNIICVFVDMKNSTRLSIVKNEKQVAKVYQLFTDTAIRIFNEYDAEYIDVKGDGVFALYNEKDIYKALVAAVSFKTFIKEEFIPILKPDIDFEIGCHIGIDQKTVLVKKIGMKRLNNQTDRQNEVWAGKTINMASKLLSLSQNNEIIVSDRFWNRLKDKKALFSCGCAGDNKQHELWKKIDVSNIDYLDFNTAYSLESIWCKNHGKEYSKYLYELEVK